MPSTAQWLAQETRRIKSSRDRLFRHSRDVPGESLRPSVWIDRRGRKRDGGVFRSEFIAVKAARDPEMGIEGRSATGAVLTRHRIGIRVGDKDF